MIILSELRVHHQGHLAHLPEDRGHDIEDRGQHVVRDARDGDLMFRPDEEVDSVEEGAQDDVADLRQGAVADLLRKISLDRKSVV